MDDQAIDLVSQLLRYDPRERINLFVAMTHPLFDELRQNNLILPNGNCIPDLFNFSENEMKKMGIDCREKLIPEWYNPKGSPCEHTVAYGADDEAALGFASRD